LLLPLSLLGGCSLLLDANNMDSIDHALLHGSPRAYDMAAVNGAFQGRFPAGAPVAGLQKMVSEAGGKCAAPSVAASLSTACLAPDLTLGRCASAPVHTLSCSIPVSGTICTATRLDVTVVLRPDDTVDSLLVKEGRDGC
jgi:hypothetical protein